MPETHNFPNVPEADVPAVVADFEAEGFKVAVSDEGGGFFAIVATKIETTPSDASAPASTPAALARPDPRPRRPLPDLRGDAKTLVEADFARAADAIGCDVAAVKAVSEVESAGAGFQADGRPRILFEAHVFSRRTNGVYDLSHPNISAPRWDRSLYGSGGARQYERLEAAMALDRNAALASASWGLFQIMGFNFEVCGFVSVTAFVTAMKTSEGRQLDAFVAFLKSNRLDAPLRAHDWAAFARGYNGPGYAENDYDVKLDDAWRKHADGPWLSAREAQAALNRHGADPKLVVDGAIGRNTRRAIRAFQASRGLPVDGRLTPAVIARLMQN